MTKRKRRWIENTLHVLFHVSNGPSCLIEGSKKNELKDNEMRSRVVSALSPTGSGSFFTFVLYLLNDVKLYTHSLATVQEEEQHSFLQFHLNMMRFLNSIKKIIMTMEKNERT